MGRAGRHVTRHNFNRNVSLFISSLFLIPPFQPCEEDPREAAKNRRCLRGKSLLLCALMLSTVLGFALLLAYTILHQGLEPCDTKECLTLLARLLEVRNATIDPCEDFYGYACGNWEANHLRTRTMESSNVFDVLLEENQLILKRLLEVPQLRVGSSAKEKAIRFYHSCMDTQQIEAEGAQPLKELINQIGGWNFTGPEKQTDFNQTLQILMGKYNTFPFFRAYVGPNSSDPSTNIIQVTGSSGDGSQKGQEQETYNSPARSSVTNLGTLLGGPQNVTSTFISFALSFISNLQKEVTPLQERRERGMLFYHTTIRELQEKAPAIDWLSCLQAAFHPVQLNISQPIAVHDMDYLKGMSPSLRFAGWLRERESKPVLQIYMILCLVGNLSPALDSRFQDARRELYEKLHGKTGESGLAHRWRKCLSDTSTFFEPVLGEMIVQEIFPQETKDLVGILLPPPKRKLILISFFSFHSYLIHYQGQVTSLSLTNVPSFFGSEAGYWSFNTLIAKIWVFFLFSFSASSWKVYPWSVHSYYSLRRHAVVFPAGMFRSPFFHAEFPSAVNFGAMGVIMAHELLHAFHDYGAYLVPESCPRCNRDALGLRINGTFTLLENAADTGGLAIAYQAYKNWLKKHKQERNLPGSGLSHHQLFYISFANVMNTLLQAFLHNDPHSPPPLRVRGPLSNSQDFARHFHCSSTAPMNPAFKCHIW
uniref:Kell metallo-endopeptidase (Kell blood group) n=1 Tax=Gopherus agassizii TaxID=38772 RepID=A0A452GQV9_9SAUR